MIRRLTLEERIMKPWEQEESRNRFLQYYRCQPLPENSQLQHTNKVNMPMSALDRLTYFRTPSPMMFSVHNPWDELFYDVNGGGRCCHSGVLNFVAEEGFVQMPQWMMDKLELREGDLVFFRSADDLPGVTYILMQPHTEEFSKLSNPKAILEKKLKEYSCLTEGDTISFEYKGKLFKFNILETKPDMAVSTVETDPEVDFAIPLNHKGPEKKATGGEVNKKHKEVGDEEGKKESEKLVPFSGCGRRLDGSTFKATTPPSKVVSTEWGSSDVQTGGGGSKVSAKLVFSSEAAVKSCCKPAGEEDLSSKKINETGGFQPFTGKKRTLMG
ncbi:OLC1v1029314C1 [Oldenlandia corymbosa var. corymbosa]|uniref:OLC1v1029314C1 n=1 Tax=Oldenlandia corymbosa var. corymbosa TaxID=529605 RepID=A0AAV1CF53_OLDCO|nr:OLC1v1029314C1 [Oldenlandia corymbosa var. corymbosa]